MNPVHTSPPYFHKICCNIIFPSTPRSSKRSLPKYHTSLKRIIAGTSRYSTWFFPLWSFYLFETKNLFKTASFCITWRRPYLYDDMTEWHSEDDSQLWLAHSDTCVRSEDEPFGCSHTLKIGDSVLFYTVGLLFVCRVLLFFTLLWVQFQG
jgi:hypothetical protein